MHHYMETEASYNPYVQAGSSLLLANQRQIPSVLTLDKVVLMSQATDLRAGMDTLRTKAIQLVGQVGPHEGYIFMNRTQTLLKMVVHDAMGTWLCTRRLHEGSFHGAGVQSNPQLSAEQLYALVLGLPWHRVGEASVFRYS